MKRIIKFRAWDKKTEKMRGWEDISRNWAMFILEGDDNTEIMQFTGLLDKNGKEIYEGDIIKTKDNFNEENIKEVVYDQDAFCITGVGRKDGGCPPDAEWFQRLSGLREIEVIGNIYESKHLLK